MNLRTIAFRARLAAARGLFSLRLKSLAAKALPKLAGAANWAGSWTLGTGYTVATTQPAYTFTDPKLIRVTEAGIFTKFLMTLAGGTQLFGKRSAFPTLEIVIAEDSAVPNLAADPPVAGTVSLIPPSGTTKTAPARVISDSMEQIGPDMEIGRVIRVQCSAVWA